MIICAPMPFLSSFLISFLTVCTYALEPINLGLATRRRIYRSLPIFFVYICFLLCRDLLYLAVQHASFVGTPAFAYTYWATEAILSVFRLATVLEICWHTLRPYTTVWALAWRVLSTIGIVLVLFGIISARHNMSRPRFFITTTMQRFELLQAVLLLAVLAIGVYYTLHIPPLYKWILVGVCFYSAIEVANFALGRITVHPTNTLFDYVHRYAFTITETIWAWALWRHGDLPPQGRESIPQDMYDEHSEEIHTRLRELNDRLKRLLR
jgi:hypothetical protein